MAAVRLAKSLVPLAIADAAGAAQALFHSRLENGLDFPAGVGNIPLVYHISENGHYIKAVGGIKVVICRNKAYMVLVKGALQKPHFDNITANPALVFDNDRTHFPGFNVCKHGLKTGPLK